MKSASHFFNHLSPEKKNKILEDKGSFLMAVEVDSQKVSLFSLFNIFVVVWSMECFNGVDRIITKSEAVEDSTLLEPFLDTISMKHLA